MTSYTLSEHLCAIKPDSLCEPQDKIDKDSKAKSHSKLDTERATQEAGFDPGKAQPNVTPNQTAMLRAGQLILVVRLLQLEAIDS